jgi:hypothetical protein
MYASASRRSPSALVEVHFVNNCSFPLPFIHVFPTTTGLHSPRFIVSRKAVLLRNSYHNCDYSLPEATKTPTMSWVVRPRRRWTFGRWAREADCIAQGVRHYIIQGQDNVLAHAVNHAMRSSNEVVKHRTS